jgi:hypothetical protein
MSRQTWVTRDAQGNVASSTEVRSTSGCSSCLWVLLGLFVVAAPAAWAGDGQIPVAVAVVMYIVEAAVAAGGIVNYLQRHRSR